MKNIKTEYRWLLFIVIPLIIILAIHTAIPLVFLFTSQPVLIESYTQQNIKNLVTSVRSFVILQSEQASTVLNSYVSFLLQLSTQIQKNPTFMDINASMFDLNNAYQFYQTYSLSQNEAVQVQQEAMWFATDDTTYSELNQQQKGFYQQFINVLPIIKFNFELENFYSFVSGVYVSFNQHGSQICFHFPSYSEPAFANLNSSIIATPFETYLNTSNLNKQVILVDNIGVGQLQPGLMSICISFSNLQQTSILGIICLKVNIQLFMNGLAQAVILLNSAAISSQAYLIQPTQANQSDPHVISHAYLTSQQLIVAFPQSETYQSLQGTQNKAWNQYLCNQGPDGVHSFSTFKNNNTQINIVPICVLQEQFGWKPLMYYSLQVQASDLITSLNSTAQTDKLLQTLLIATIVAIFVFLLFSFCILKKLLKDLDIQLYKLHKCCKFIANGDINIDIPDYSGTKDIALVYEEVKNINKLFRYTSKDYFLGHSSDKILKYIEAINTFLKLNYNPSSLYENLGEVFIQLQDFVQAIRHLKQSVDLLSSEMVEQFGDFQKVMQMKADREIKLPAKYKQNELILIRRLWKLNYSYLLYFDNTFTKDSQAFLGEQEEKKWQAQKDEYLLDMMRYTTMFKQVVYPDYGTFAEAILLFLNEARFYIKEKNFENAKTCWQKAVKYVSIYSKQYDANGARLKQKGSKNKLFYRKHKLSRHSRCHPHILQSYCKYIEALLKMHLGHNCDYFTAITLLFQALKRGVLSQTVNFMIISKVIQIMNELSINKVQLQSTQIFRQILPRKTLNYKEETPDTEALFYKLQRKQQQVESRQFIFMYDIGALLYSSRSKQNLLDYFSERSQYIFDKHIKSKDRISITKFNSIIQLDTLCNLTFKQAHEEILKKSFTEVLVPTQFRGKGWLIHSLKRIIYRVGHLQCEKIIVVFLRPMHSYVEAHLRKKSKNKASSPLKRGGSINIQMNSLGSMEEMQCLTEVGEEIEELMQEQEMRNCKLILLCSKLDDEEQVIRVFGLKEINRRIWSRSENLNIFNNIVYVIDQKHKLDLQRILAVKTAHYADNHVFVL